MEKAKFDPDGLKKTNAEELADYEDLGELETEDIDDEEEGKEGEEDLEDKNKNKPDDSEEENEEDLEDNDEDEDENEDEDKDKNEDEEDAKTIEKLLKRIDELSSAKPTISEASLEKPIDFNVLTDEDFETFQAAETKEDLNKVFNKMLNTVLQKSIELSEYKVSRRMENKMTANKIAEQFYRENEDLAPVSNYVLNIAQAIAKDEENKDLSLAQLLEKAGGLARKALGLKKASKEDRKDGKKRKPKVPAPKGSRAGKKAHKGSEAPTVRDEIDELVNYFKPRSLK